MRTIAELRRLYEAGTKAPWYAFADAEDDQPCISAGTPPDYKDYSIVLEDGDISTEDAALMVAAHNDFPALLDAVEVLEWIADHGENIDRGYIREVARDALVPFREQEA